MNSCISRFPKETCPFPLAVCVPWVEPVKVRHCGCAGCAHFIGAFDCGHQDVVKDMAGDYCGNWTPKKPEPVKHYLCDGCHPEYSGIESQRCEACRDFDDINDAGQVYHQFWTPKEPKPAAKLEHHNFSSRPCSTCGWMRDGRCGCTVECHGDQWKARDTEAAPGLVCTIEEVVEVIKLICNTNGINAESAVSTALKHMKELHEAVTMLSAQP